MNSTNFLKAYTGLRKVAQEVKYPTSVPLWEGGSIHAVANKYGYPVKAVENANKHLLGKTLRVGQQINLPWGGRYNTYTHPRSGRTLRLHPNYRPQVDPQLLKTIAHLESTGGKFREGDIRNGVAYARGKYQIRKEFPKDMQNYLRARRGKHRTGSAYIDYINDGFGVNGKPIYSLADREDDAKAEEMVRHYLLLKDHNYFVNNGAYMPRASLFGAHNGSGNKAAEYGRKAIAYEQSLAGNKAPVRSIPQPKIKLPAQPEIKGAGDWYDNTEAARIVDKAADETMERK